jgi:hypothetical protein
MGSNFNGNKAMDEKKRLAKTLGIDIEVIDLVIKLEAQYRAVKENLVYLEDLQITREGMVTTLEKKYEAEYEAAKTFLEGGDEKGARSCLESRQKYKEMLIKAMDEAVLGRSQISEANSMLEQLSAQLEDLKQLVQRAQIAVANDDMDAAVARLRDIKAGRIDNDDLTSGRLDDPIERRFRELEREAKDGNIL